MKPWLFGVLQWKVKWSILIINKLACQDFNDTENLLQQESFQRDRRSFKIHCQGSVLQNRLEWDCGHTVSVYRGGKICGIIFPNLIKHRVWNLLTSAEGWWSPFFLGTFKSWPWKDYSSLFSPICPQPVNQISVGGQAVKQELDIVRYQQDQNGTDNIVRTWRNRQLRLGE